MSPPQHIKPEVNTEADTFKRYTRINYVMSNATLVFDRSASSLAQNFTKTNYYNYLEPYVVDERYENLDFDIFVDGSLVEIFVNGRFAFTSRIYPTRADANGLSLFTGGERACFKNVQIWDIEKTVWPKRPLNSNSPLHYEPYYKTHITFEGVPGMPVGTKLYDGY